MNDEEFNSVDWPDIDEIDKEAREDEKTFLRLPASVIERNVAHALAQFTFIEECGVSADWPNIETWLDDPEAVLADFQKFFRIYKKLVNYDPDNGYYFAKISPAQMAWGLFSHTYPEAMQAAIAITPLPISIDRLNRVVDIYSMFSNGHEKETPRFDESGNPAGTGYTWNPLTFTEQKKLCSEGIDILESMQSALELFVKVKKRQRDSAPSAEQHSSEREQFAVSATASIPIVREQEAIDFIGVWQSVFGMPPGDAVDDANEAAFYAEFPAELADELARDLLRFERTNASEIKEQWIYWTDSVLTQPPAYYRLLQSLITECPVNFEVFGRLRLTVEKNEDVSLRVAIESAKAELRLFGLWLESKGLWNKRPGSELDGPKGAPAVRPNKNMVTPIASEHYDSVIWNGVPYTFTTKQAAVVKVLWEAWRAGKPSVLAVDLIDAAQSDGKRVRDIFKPGRKTNPAWGTMIIKAGQSHYQLSDPKTSEPQ